MELQSVNAGSIDVSDANIAANKGQLAKSWSEATAVSSTEVLFTLVFRATNAGQLSTALNLNSSVTKAEAYMGTSLDLSLIHISEPTRQEAISYAVFCLKKKN